MRLTETIPAAPIQVQKSVRPDEIRCLTSGPAGKILPLAYSPLLREDRVSRGRVRVRVEMMETAEMLMNAINVTCYAHFVPFLAFPQFNGMDSFNRAYKGVPEEEGGQPIDFFPLTGWTGNAEIYQTMGLHRAGGAGANHSVKTAYNLIVNHRRKARSAKLPMRDLTDGTLAEAFWKHTNMNHIVPDFDQAMIDGEVQLNFAQTQLPVSGIGVSAAHSFETKYARETGKTVGTEASWSSPNDMADEHDFVWVKRDPDNPLHPAIFAEMQAEGVTLSLSNIELAKKTAAFAKLRSQFSGLDDDHIIDLLMQGVRVPEAQLTQPILLDRKSTIVGYNRRYATDGANLSESVTSGETFVDLSMVTPPMNTGGIVLITCEVVPEQLFERQKDYFLYASSPEDLPNFTRDYLDPEKVAVVQNDHVDVAHTDPSGTFGYAPLNHQWKRAIPRIGGKYLRSDPNAPFDEDRQKIWAAETVDPTLTEDFYLVTDLHTKVFADQESDPFEITTLGRLDIVGNTVFGKGLQEATDDYDKLIDQVDTGRIDQEA